MNVMELEQGARVMVRPFMGPDELLPATFEGYICETQPSAENPEEEEPAWRAIVRYADGELDEVCLGDLEPVDCEHEWIERDHALIGLYKRCRECRQVEMVYE